MSILVGAYPTSKNRRKALAPVYYIEYTEYHMAPEMRDEAISLRLSRDEMQMLKGLAAATGLSQSDVLRQALRASWAEYQTKSPSKKKR